MPPTYKFQLFKITSVKPTGNARLGSKYPQARSGHRIVADNGNIYSFGGYNPLSGEQPVEDFEDFIWVDSCVLFKELWKFNIATKTWTKLKPWGSMPEELASHAAILLDEHLLVFGGTGLPFGMSSSNSLHLCNLKNLTWTEIPTTGDLPLQQYGQAIAVRGNKLYVVGGTTGFEYSMDVHCLDMKTKIWKELKVSERPHPRYRHEVAIDDNQLFVFGGGTATDSFSLKEIPVFNIEDQEWRIVPATSKNHPMDRRCHGCVQMESDVYISGGQNGGTVLSDIWMIDLKTLEWTKLPCELPQPVYFHSAAVTPEGQMFIFGGVTSMEANTRTSEMYSVWLKIPSLKEICWQSVLHYMPHIGEISKRHLLADGVPHKFLERVDFVKLPQVKE